MWGMIIRVAVLLGIGAAVGSSVSNTPVIQTVPQPVYQEASSSISPFLVISVGVLLFAGGYFIWSLRRGR